MEQVKFLLSWFLSFRFSPLLFSLGRLLFFFFRGVSVLGRGIHCVCTCRYDVTCEFVFYPLMACYGMSSLALDGCISTSLNSYSACCLSVGLSVCLSVCSSACLSAYPSARLPSCLFVCPSVWLYLSSPPHPATVLFNFVF